MRSGKSSVWLVRMALVAAAALIVPACANDGDDGSAGPQGPPGSANAWSRLGNAGTVDGTNFVGTTDNVALDVRVNDTRALRLEPTADTPNLIGGFSGNTVTAGAVGATIAGGGTSANANSVTDAYGTVGGGTNNRAGDALGTTIDREYATVGGGNLNTASGVGATVAGGSGNNASGGFATVGGGTGSTAGSLGATVGGGTFNFASGVGATVGGGSSNVVSGGDATVGGGSDNNASGPSSTISGGDHNHAIGSWSTVAGGQNNVASGLYASVPGGFANTASGPYSFAAGRNALSAASGTFTWGDSTGVALTNATANQFMALASGGYVLYSNTAGSTGVTLAAGGGAWAAVSDRNVKANVVAADGRETLRKLAEIPIATWNYTSQDPSIRHIGPMAQDFHAAFKVGEDEKRITTVDADGVALSAIQGLYAVVKEENAALKARIEKLEKLVERLAK